MDITTTLIGLLVVALILIPFIAMGRNSGKRSRELLRLLRDLAAEHDGNITASDQCRDFALGFDGLNRAVYYVKRGVSGTETRRIDLNQVRECRLSQTKRTVRQGRITDTHTDSLKLVFSLAAVKQPDIALELYNSEESMQMSNEYQLANKWTNLVNDTVTARRGAPVA